MNQTETQMAVRSALASRLALAATIAIWLSQSAHAAILAHTELVKSPPGAPFESPDSALSSPWVSYKLWVTSDLTVQAVEVGIRGALHQRWTDQSSTGNFVPSVYNANQADGDSHLLVLPGMIFADIPSEDNSGVGSPLSPTNDDSIMYGVGTNLSGTFGHPGAPASYMDVAYLVIPKGSERDLDIRVHVLGYIDEEEIFDTSDFFPVPEPSFTAIGGMALVGLGVMRRKRQV